MQGFRMLLFSFTFTFDIVRGELPTCTATAKCTETVRTHPAGLRDKCDCPTPEICGKYQATMMGFNKHYQCFRPTTKAKCHAKGRCSRYNSATTSHLKYEDFCRCPLGEECSALLEVPRPNTYKYCRDNYRV